MQSSDVLVVGKGNAALCAALAAREAGACVTMLEAASQEEAGGNNAFAGGVMRFYPSGTGLVSGAVFGRLAGTNAAAAATGRQ